MSEEWSIETTERRATVKKASRVQIPLKLGYVGGVYVVWMFWRGPPKRD